jgi:phenylacetate-CoA ligase
MLIIRGVNVFPTQIEELILKLPALAPHYVLEVTREGPLDSMTVHVEPAGSGSAAAGTAAARDLVQQVKAYVGISVHVNLGAPGFIERSIGKARRVIDKRTAPAG